MVLNVGKSKIKLLANSGSSEDSLPIFQMAAFPLCPDMAERKKEKKRELSVSLLIRALIPTDQGPAS